MYNLADYLRCGTIGLALGAEHILKLTLQLGNSDLSVVEWVYNNHKYFGRLWHVNSKHASILHPTANQDSLGTS